MNLHISNHTTTEIVNPAASTGEQKQKQTSPKKKHVGKIKALREHSITANSGTFIERRSGEDRRHYNAITHRKLDSRAKKDRRAPAISIQI